ncbi:MAG: sigma-70 family RNA polymerase sigma factor [Firmicutes bacterium]|nr:sigma-70 family RNA polymerase sigma factor [Bacillota bacterium]
MSFEEIYRVYFRDIYLFLLGLSRDTSLSEELTEESFFRAMKALPKFRGDCDIRVWLCQIAKHTYYEYLRKNRHLVDEKENQEPSLMQQGIEERIVDKDSARRIHEIVHELQEPYKEVFYLRVFGELSFEQIGSIFGKTANWACVTYHRAKSRIQDKLHSS